MKIVIIGGSGLIGSHVVRRLRAAGHEAVAASPATGVDVVSGKGLAGLLEGAGVVIDVANSPSFEDRAALEFFEKAGRNLLAAGAAAGVRHHLALSVVGTERLLESGYFRAKLVQEELIAASSIPHTLLRSTQFFEFIGRIADAGRDGDAIRVSPALMQPVAADEVATALAGLALGAPVNGMVEIAGPEARPLDSFVRRSAAARGDERRVIADIRARYFGVELDDRSLMPGADPRLGRVHFGDWLDHARVH